MSVRPPNLRSLARIGLAVGAAVAILWGWRELWFLTDDAYIAFRYAHNMLAGRGLAWNPPPFAPVEGYTSFSWVVLLAGTWAATGLEPPLVANVWSLLFGGAGVALGALWVSRLVPDRLSVVAVFLVGVCTSRTYLTWLSSGLETALFNLVILWWLFEALAPGDRRPPWRLAAAAALAALTRPDGLLYVAATLPLLGLRWRSAWPLAAVAAHLLWRKVTYGLWLPNTYYAKVTEPWPESGLRDLACFILEHGVWFWLLLVGAWLLRRPRPRPSLRGVVTVGALLAHMAYYVFRVGGDHFEYRVLSHAIIPIYISAAWLAMRVARPALAPVLVLVLAGVAAPIGWVHHAQTRDLHTRAETEHLVQPIADLFPFLLRPVIRPFDTWQEWLIVRFVGVRHREHQAFPEYMAGQLPTRELGQTLTWDQRPIWTTRSVGLAGWVLPNTAIIDELGLNDAVIARGPDARLKGGHRQMAHERLPPDGYLECFRVNLTGGRLSLAVDPSVPRMSDDEIRACERDFMP